MQIDHTWWAGQQSVSISIHLCLWTNPLRSWEIFCIHQAEYSIVAQPSMSWASTRYSLRMISNILSPRGIGLEIGKRSSKNWDLGLGLGLWPLPVMGLLSNSINLISFFRSNCCPAAAAANVPEKCTTKLRSNHVPNELPRGGGQALPRGGVAAHCCFCCCSHLLRTEATRVEAYQS